MVPTLLRAAALVIVVALIGFAGCSDATGINSGTGPGACGTCAYVYTNGGIVCGPGASNDAWIALDNCVCGAPPCASVCFNDGDGGRNLCTIGPANAACSACIADTCAAQLSTCAAN